MDGIYRVKQSIDGCGEDAAGSFVEENELAGRGEEGEGGSGRADGRVSLRSAKSEGKKAKTKVKKVGKAKARQRKKR